MILTADRIIPVGAPPRDGALLVRDGRIARVAPLAALVDEHPREPVRSFPGCVLLPGLVNAHVHLEYSALARLARPGDFVPWIRALVRASRRRMLLGRWYWARSARRGIRRLFEAGVTCAGDTTTFGASARAAARLGLRARVFVEAVAIPAHAAAAAVRRLAAALGDRSLWSERVRPGLAPHAVYTLAPEALDAVGALARERGLPVSIHLGETAHERSLLRGEGPIALQIPRWGLPFGPGFAGGLGGYLDRRGLLGPRTLLVHGVHLDGDDLDLAAARGCRLATCPRSNAMLQAGTADWAAWSARRVQFAYGTDSLASAPGFDLFAEARAVRERHREAAGAIMRRLTLGGAEALGFEDVAGTLEEGKAADVVALRLDRPAEATEEDVVREGCAARVAATIAGGRVVHERRVA